MADARKRAKRRAGSPGGTEPPAGAGERAAQPAEPAARRRPDAVIAGIDLPAAGTAEEILARLARQEAAAAGEAAAWESREEPLVFPADAAPSRPAARLELPSSGTAEEILAREAERERTADAAAAVEPQPAAEPEGAGEGEAAAAPAVSFFASSSREEAKAVELTEHLATFFLDREEYGVDVRMVQEIIRVTAITQVPRAPEFVRGVINLRGRIIPVVDLKRKLGLGRFDETRQSRIVVVKLRERLLGLLVDGASQVLKVPLASIEAAPEEVLEVDQSAIRGVAKLSGRLIILLELQKVLALELRAVAGGAA
ncbi:MAG: chemotaxis protein CheW [Vicinamibacteria bacterium]